MGSVIYLVILLVVLILLGAFFSASETGMMATNLYRVRHLVRKGRPDAKRVAQLLERPDRLLGVILIGNTFANIMASSIGTVIAVHYFGEVGVIIATIVLTFLILIFSEATPKTLAALYPERIAFTVSFPLQIVLKILYPFVWFVNAIANTFLRVWGVKVSPQPVKPISSEELRTIVHEADGKSVSNCKHMLLGTLDLGHMTVLDVMTPRNRVRGIDVNDEWDKIVEDISVSNYEYLPIYRENVDNVIGIINLRHVMRLLSQQQLTKEKLISQVEEVYFIPEMTLLNQQLLSFRQNNKTIGFVVDEYGDIQGLITLWDILEEIVGNFPIRIGDPASLVHKQRDGSYLIDGRIGIRDLNRITRWNLSTTGPKTLGGLIVEHLENIPISDVCLRLGGYPMEVVKVGGNAVRLVRVWPDKWIAEEFSQVNG